MKILLIGTIESINKIESIIKNYKLEFIRVIIDDTDSLDDILGPLPSDIDGIFASGVGVFNKLIHSYDIDVPISYARRGATSFSKCLIKNYENIKTYKSPSFDCLDKKLLDSLIYDYDINIDDYKIIKYNSTYGENAYLLNHIDLYKKGKIDCVFTAYGYSYNVLKDMGIPVFRLEATKADIEEDFEKLITRINIKDTEDKSFLIHNFHMDFKDPYLRSLIDDYASVFEGLVLDQDGEVLVISNRGISINELEESIEIFNKKNIKLKLTLASGNTIREGIDNSMYARKFLDSRKSVVMYDGKNIKFLSTNKTFSSYDIDNDHLFEISRSCGISLEYIQKITLYTKNKKTSTITSSQLSSILKITRRTANRIMNKLIENKYATELYIKDGNKGRPTKAIEILF